ncbi:MAG TPA: helix-turn-helix transcriptional regulator [Thermoanaerobaculia bacterium]|jgi:plasmid maintenance system antidote protein VapI|nr:helix-turn-helix transcriptional regulator [Thermoanaerobaculia bacterium]
MKSSKPLIADAPDELATSLERLRKFVARAETSVDYWVDGPITEFIEDVWRLMEEQKVSRAELARRLGTSRAYVTKLLGGNANFTLQTMTKVAMALGSQVHVHVAGQNVLTRWIDEIPAQQDQVAQAAEAAVARSA